METPPNVICLVLDTVRADRVSAYGHDRETTPTFDAFAADATTYTDAVAQAPWSIPSHGSLFTGRYPADHGATTTSPVLQDGPTLPELLWAAGYDTHAVSPNEYIRPATGFARGFDSFEMCATVTEPPGTADVVGPLLDWGGHTPSVRRPVERAFNALHELGATTTGTVSPPADGVVGAVETVLSSSSSPFFLFVNLLDAHLPRSPDPAHEEQFVDDALDDVAVVTNERAHAFGDYEMGPRAMRKMRQLYDADLRTMDDRLDTLLSTLQAAGVLEDSLVAIFSDHGEHLGEFGLVGHQHSVFDSVVSVPLAVQYPDGGPDRVDDQVELRRLFHTVLDEAGVESYPERSLASGIGDDTARGAFYTPLLDLGEFLWEDTVRYDADLVDEALSFVRTGETKRIQFGDEEWLFELPEWEADALSLDHVPEADDWLPERTGPPASSANR